MRITKRSNGRYVAQYVDSITRTIRYAYGKNEQEVIDKITQNNHWTLNQAYDYYMANKQGLAESSRGTYAKMIGLVDPALRERILSTLTMDEVERWWHTLGHLAPSTRNTLAVVLGTIWRYCFDRELPVGIRNPWRFVSRAKTKARMVQVMNSEQIARLLEACKPNQRTLLTTAILTGIRASEITSLTTNDYDPVKQTITIHRAYTKTDAGERVLPVPTRLAPLLAQQRADALVHWPDGGPLFFGRWRGRYNRLNPVALTNNVLFPALTYSGLYKEGFADLRWHDLRHMAISLLVAQGASIEDVQAYAGHTSWVTTAKIYAKLTQAHSRRVRDKLDDILRDVIAVEPDVEGDNE